MSELLVSEWSIVVLVSLTVITFLQYMLEDYHDYLKVETLFLCNHTGAEQKDYAK